MNSPVRTDIRGQQFTPTQAEAIKRHAAFMRKIADRAVDLPPVLPPTIPHAPEPDPPRMAAPYSFKETWFWPACCSAPTKISVRQIKEMVCERFGIKMNDLMSERRTKDVAVPRMVAMYFCKEMTLQSLPEIGRRFGGRDHTTVLHATRAIPKKMLVDADLAAKVAGTQAALEALLP